MIVDNSTFTPETALPWSDFEGVEVVYAEWDGNDWEIWTWLDGLRTQITNNSVDDLHPDISNGSIVWRRWDGSDWEIWYWDGAGETPITNNVIDDGVPQFQDGVAIWSDGDLWAWNGTVQQLTSGVALSGMNTSGGNVVWAQNDGNDFEIWQWDGSASSQVTDNAVVDRNPFFYQGTISWDRGNASDWGSSTAYRIFQHDGTNEFEVTMDLAKPTNGSTVFNGQRGVYYDGGNLWLYDPLPSWAIRNLEVEGSTVSWDHNLCQPPYDIIRGDMSNISEGQFNILLGEVFCVEAASIINSSVDTPDPAPGECWFYLVRNNEGFYGQNEDGKYLVPTVGDCP